MTSPTSSQKARWLRFSNGLDRDACTHGARAWRAVLASACASALEMIASNSFTTFASVTGVKPGFRRVSRSVLDAIISIAARAMDARGARAWRAVFACERARICDGIERGAVVENRCVDSPRQTRLPVRFAQRSCPSSMTSSRARERPPERDARFLCVDSNDAACKRKKYISLHLPPTFVVV